MSLQMPPFAAIMCVEILLNPGVYTHSDRDGVCEATSILNYWNFLIRKLRTNLFNQILLGLIIIKSKFLIRCD